MSLFPTDGFVPQPGHYPNLFLIEKQWHEAQPQQLGVDSVETPHSSSRIKRIQFNYHAEMTLAVVQAIAPNIPNANITRISLERNMAEGMNKYLFKNSLSEALASLDFFTNQKRRYCNY